MNCGELPGALVLSGSEHFTLVGWARKSGPDQRELTEAHRPLDWSDRQ